MWSSTLQVEPLIFEFGSFVNISNVSEQFKSETISKYFKSDAKRNKFENCILNRNILFHFISIITSDVHTSDISNKILSLETRQRATKITATRKRSKSVSLSYSLREVRILISKISNLMNIELSVTQSNFPNLLGTRSSVRS